MFPVCPTYTKIPSVCWVVDITIEMRMIYQKSGFPRPNLVSEKTSESSVIIGALPVLLTHQIDNTVFIVLKTSLKGPFCVMRLEL